MQKDNSIKSKIFTRRAIIILFGKLTLMSSLVARLYYLQILKSDNYKTQSDNNRIKILPIIPKRGVITDHHDKILAINRDRYQVFVNRSSSTNFESNLKKISYITSINYDDLNHQLEINSAYSNTEKILILDNLDWEDLIRIELELFDLPGVTIEIAQTRYYPYNINTAHIIGYISNESNKKNISNVKFGKTGIEKSYNNELFGQIGFKKYEVNAYGKLIRELYEKEPIDGSKIKLSIDIDLQNFVANRLAEYSAASVVIGIDNGNILSLVSSPSFDANQFSSNITHDYWQKVNNDDRMPLINRAISAQYPPGSIFKLIVAIAALEDNISPELKYECCGYILVGERKFHCWQERGHGTINLTQAIALSCNCYFFNLSKKIGIDKIVAISIKFNLGQKLGIEIDGEASGLIPSKKWKRSKLKKEWQIGDSFNASIGQGYLLTTPLQLAVVTAKIASGKNIIPSLVFNKEKIFDGLDIKKNNLEIIRNAMYKAVNQPGASAYRHRIDNNEKAMAGKTGTSQVISKKNIKDDLSRIDIIKSNRNHGLFVCYAPFHQPKYACCIVVEHGGSGGGAAAPLAREIMLKIQDMDI